MLAERWFHSPEHGPVHVGAWQADLATFEEMIRQL